MLMKESQGVVNGVGQLIFSNIQNLKYNSWKWPAWRGFYKHTQPVVRRKVEHRSGPVQEIHLCLADGISKILFICFFIHSLNEEKTYIEQLFFFFFVI